MLYHFIFEYARIVVTHSDTTRFHDTITLKTRALNEARAFMRCVPLDSKVYMYQHMRKNHESRNRRCRASSLLSTCLTTQPRSSYMYYMRRPLLHPPKMTYSHDSTLIFVLIPKLEAFLTKPKDNNYTDSPGSMAG